MSVFSFKFYFTSLCVFICLGTSYAQEAPDTLKKWTNGGLISANISQVSLHNWSAGGQSSYSATGLLNLFSDYQLKNVSWSNSLDLAYGILQQGKGDIIKVDDKIDVTSKYAYKALKDINYTALLNFKSQFSPGYNYPNDSILISNFLAPGYILLSLGLEYKPHDNFYILISPLTNKTTIVNDRNLANKGAFGVEAATYDDAGTIITPGEMIRMEFGSFLKMKYQKEVLENVSFQTTLELFSNYLHNPQNIDVNWETMLTMKVNKVISANISTHLIYDDDIDIAVDTDGDQIPDRTGPRTQFKEVLSIGLSYKL